MSLFRTLDRTSAVSNTSCANTRPFLTFLYPGLYIVQSKKSFSKNAIIQPPRSTRHAHHEETFIRALARAGSCKQHAMPMSSLRQAAPHSVSHHKARGKSTWQKPSTTSDNTTSELKRSGPLPNIKQFARDQLKALVDYYSINLETKPEEEPKHDGPQVWNVGDKHHPWPLQDRANAKHLRRLIKLLENDESPHEEVFDTYKELPWPGVVYLKTITIRALLNHMSVVERPTTIAMQRYLSILDDLKAADIHIIRSEWTAAIHLAGKAMGRVTEDNLQTALNIWRDMEHGAGMKGGYVTLNILFDMSVKAGKYELAETFVKILQERKLPFHRHFRISLIYYYGVLQNGDEVRKTYQQLVNAGDIVDTVVMNAVIAALIRAGEPSAAEHVFERMKRLHATRRVSAPGHRFYNRSWRDRRMLGLHLTYEGRRLSKGQDHEAVKQLQDYAPIAPDTRTYGLLIRHQATTAGNIDRVYELLEEMRYNSVPLEGTIFIAIFHGFTAFGGVRYSPWTRDKLEKQWKQYLKALHDGLDRTWVSVMSVVAALKAFAKCTDPDRTLQAWEEIRKFWQPNEQELEDVVTLLRKLLPQHASQQGFFDGLNPPS